ncbi:hypothetical protein LINGRAHAP2_LOCUS20090 [Linum grandiflorum]
MWTKKSITATQKKQNPEFNMCCNGGKIRRPTTLEPLAYLKELMLCNNGNNKYFHEYTRAYNGIYYFTSLGGKINRELNDGRSVYTYSIGGGGGFSPNWISTASRRDSTYVWPIIYL